MNSTNSFVKVPYSKHHGLSITLTLALLFSGIQGISQQRNQGASTASGNAIIKEYNSIISRYDLNSAKGRNNFANNISPEDRKTLETIYNKMSKTQQSQQRVAFLPNVPAPKEKVPTDKQLEEWEDAKRYEVWIDGKKVENKTLADFSITDFATFSLNKLNKTAVNSGKPADQVKLMTKEYYQETFKQTADKTHRYNIVVRNQ